MSVRRQTIGIDNIEMIVVDDGSDDRREVDRYDFVKLYHINHCGASQARNFGLKQATGEFVFFADADCLLFDDCFEHLLQPLIHDYRYSFSYSSFFIVKEDGWIISFKSCKYNVELLKQVNYISACSMLRRSDCCVEWRDLKRFQDWCFWIELAMSGRKGLFIDEYLFFHFERNNSLSKMIDYDEAKKQMYNVLKDKLIWSD